MSLAAGIVAALVAAAPGYSELRLEAEPITNLGRFLERYLGDCESDDPSFDKRSCEEGVAEVRKRWNDKLLVIEIEAPEEQLRLAELEARRKAYRLHLTPFFGERALAMTVGKPDRLNKDGLPVMKNIPIWVAAPDGRDDFNFRRQLERGMVRLELLVRARRPWRLERKGETPFRGLEVELAGLRLYPLQGRAVLAEQTY